MKGTRVASRYAKSLLLLANDQNELDRAYADMKTVVDVCKENRDFALLLKSPIVKTDKKLAILKQVFDGQLGAMANGFVDIITRKKREYLLQDIATSFVWQYKTFKHITTAEITSAVKLDDAQRAKVLALLHSDGEVDIVEKVDEEILGGFIVRIGDKQVDASISRRINSLRKEFDKNLYVADY